MPVLGEGGNVNEKDFEKAQCWFAERYDRFTDESLIMLGLALLLEAQLKANPMVTALSDELHKRCAPKGEV